LLLAEFYKGLQYPSGYPLLDNAESTFGWRLYRLRLQLRKYTN